MLILTLLCVGTGQLAVVGQAGNLLTKKYHVSMEQAGGIMGRYQFITAGIKPFAVIFAYYFGSRGAVIAFSSLISAVAVFVMGMAGSSEADLVKAMMIILPVMTGLYYPIFFNAVSLTTTEDNVAVAMSFCIVVAGFGQAVIPTAMGIISDSQTPGSYTNAYLFLGIYVGLGALVSIVILFMDSAGNKVLQRREGIKLLDKEPSFVDYGEREQEDTHVNDET
jgi:tryptophan-rich sensory protein